MEREYSQEVMKMPRYKIIFDGNAGDGPGGGAPDNDYYYEHLFRGTDEEAKKHAEKLYWENYRADIGYYIRMGSLKVTALSGPSCAGKGPLMAAIFRFKTRNPYWYDFPCTQIPIIKNKSSRPNGPRPDELKLWDDPRYFLEEKQFANLDQNRYLIKDCRGILQALDLDEVLNSEEDMAVIEAFYPFVEDLESKLYQRTQDEKIGVNTVFLSPFSRQELRAIPKKEQKRYVADTMRPKLNRRSKYHHQLKSENTKLSEKEKADNQKRAESAYEELKHAWTFNHVLYNPFGEDDIENWHYKGEVQEDGTIKFVFDSKPSDRVMGIIDIFADIMRGRKISGTEQWERSLLE